MNFIFNLKKISNWSLGQLKRSCYKILFLLLFFCLAAAFFLFYRFALYPVVSDNSQLELTKINYVLYDKIIQRIGEKEESASGELQDVPSDIFR